MKQLHQIKKNLPLFLLLGILMLCFGFILINCGKGPQGKITNPDAGQFAIDFGLSPNGAIGAVFVVSENLPSLKDKEFTVEAWIKTKGTSTTGNIFGRYDNHGGTLMWIKNNEPKFAIRLPNLSGTGTPRDFTVESNFILGANKWHHIAGVLVNAVHTHPSSTFGAACATAAAETPHIDIYVDGDLKNCASTGSEFLPDFICDPLAVGTGVCAADTIAIGAFIGGAASDGTLGAMNGVVDEGRFWTVARTQEQIKACKDQELSLDTGVCGVMNVNLSGYLRFNEGKGDSINDFSGLGSGSKESPPATPWDGGWVSGAPITKKD